MKIISLNLLTVLILMVVTSYALGQNYANGYAAYEAQDYETACKLWINDARQGDSVAQFNLGYLYAKGLGLPKSNPHAYPWWLVASANGYGSANRNLSIAQHEMTRAEIKQGEHIAEEILSSMDNLVL
ncbi:MAG: sel1 repeat family protein, partial [Deltaproteobacteria bacterium]|nr:sel1 repeat family protein [Deltaproteobacteria bacterium]